MKNFIINNKEKILFTLFFALLILFLSNNVFATDVIEFTDRFGKNLQVTDFDIDGYDISNGYAIKYRNNDIDLFLLDNDSYFTVTNADFFISKGKCHIFRYSNSQWNYIETINARGYRLGLFSEYNYFSVNLYDHNNHSVVAYEAMPDFFWVAPPEEIPEEETPKAGTLQEIMEQLEKEAVLKEIVALLPVILSVLVFSIALRKALLMLLDFLRAS